MITQIKWLQQENGVGLNAPWMDGKARELGKQEQQVETGKAFTHSMLSDH